MIEINQSRKEVKTPWGSEQVLVAVSGKYMMKRLVIEPGQKGGLQYHRVKDEAGFVLEGRLLVRFVNDEGSLDSIELKAGDWFHFPPGEIHQEEALERTVILECGLPFANDRVRVEGRFGIDGSGYGFPTSEESEIKRL